MPPAVLRASTDSTASGRKPVNFRSTSAILRRRIVEGLVVLDSTRRSPDDPVGLPKGDALPRQVFRDIGRDGKAFGRLRQHPLPVEAGVPEHGGEDVQAGPDGVHRVEEWLLVLLKVTIVAHREALHEGQEGDQMAIDASGLSPNELRDVGFFFAMMLLPVV